MMFSSWCVCVCEIAPIPHFFFISLFHTDTIVNIPVICFKHMNKSLLNALNLKYHHVIRRRKPYIVVFRWLPVGTWQQKMVECSYIMEKSKEVYGGDGIRKKVNQEVTGSNPILAINFLALFHFLTYSQSFFHCSIYYYVFF